jgi:hypothetical protein
MLLEFDITHCTRVCAATGRTFAPGETYFSTLHSDRGATVRKDYCAAEWRGADDNAIAWWKSRVDHDARPKLAPQDVLLNLFADLANRQDEAEFRYVLGLLLVRRRLLKLDETRRVGQSEVMALDCPRRNEQYELIVATPDAERAEQLQQRLVELLYGGG